MIPRWTTFALAFALAGFTRGVASAQTGTITIAAGDASSANIAPGAKFTVPVVVDMSNAGGLDLASLTTRLTWTPARFTLDSIRAANFGFVASTIGTGTASVAVFEAQGTRATTTVANLYFTAATATAGSRIQIAPTVVGNELGASISSHVHARGLDVCVAPETPWGDANGDGTVNIIDAQQIARFSVGLSVVNAAALGSGDVTADGSVDITDAQQIAASVVALSASPRIGTMASQVPTVTGVAIQPTTLEIGIAQTVQLLAVPQDANGAPLTGCTPLNWTSADETKATVDVNGIVTGIASGSTSITATGVNGSTGTLSLTVATPIVTLSMSPDTATIHMGEQLSLSATAHDGNGATLPATVAFSSSDPSVATVSSTGQVTALNVGPVTITASARGRSAATDLQVAPRAEDALATGDDFSCLLSVTGAAYCWGSDSTFQLGDGSTTNRNRPVAVAVPASLRFTKIIAGTKGACALATTQSVYCWGSRHPSGVNVNPTLGSDTLHLQAVTGWGAAQHGGICMLNLVGTAYCLGDGIYGQMGTGTLDENSSPREVSGGLTFQSISSSSFAVCGLSSGAAYCWGNDAFKSLGTGSPANTAVPGLVTGGHTFRSVIVGSTLTCGVTTTGDGYCWGTGSFGGDGSGVVTTSTPHPAPTLITGGLTFTTVWGQTGPRDVSASCGLTTDGTAYCWGSNSRGQLGTTVALPDCGGGCTATPTLVQTTAKFVTLRPGGEHACGITADHRVLCWGRNSSGQLGDGFNANQSVPVEVVVGGVRVP